MFVVVVFFLTIFFLSCSEQEDKNLQSINVNDVTKNNITKSDELEFGYLDENNVFYQMPVFIYDSTTSIAKLYEMKYSEYGYPVTIKMTLNKFKYDNEEMEEIMGGDHGLFISNLKNPTAKYCVVELWFVDENGNELSKQNCFFYINKETDSNYILTTQIVLDGKYIGGPIFFVDYKHAEKLDKINQNLLYEPGRDSIKIISASRTGHLKLERKVIKQLADGCCGDIIGSETISIAGIYPDTIETVIDMRNSKVYLQKVR